MSTKRIVYLITFFLSIQSYQTIQSQSVAQQQVNIALNWQHQFQFAGYYAAIKKGYYKEEGLEVNLIENTQNQSAIEAVLKGEAEYGVTSSELVVARANGKPVVILASIFQHSPIVLISRSESNLRYLADYVGKTIMTTPFDKYEISLMFAKEGIDPRRINFIPHEYTLDPLINKKIDGTIDYISMQPNQLKNKGIEPRVMSPIDYGIDFYGDAFFSSENEINKNPLRAEQMTRATLRGWEYAMINKEEIIDYILTIPSIKKRGITRSDLQNEAKKMEELIQPKYIEIGHINPHRWDKIAQMFASQGMIPENYSLDGFIVMPGSPYQRQHYIVRIITILLFSATAMFLIVLLLNQRLKKIVNKRTLELAKLVNKDEALQRALPDLMFVFDKECRITDYHPRDGRIGFAVAPNQFLGKNIREILPEYIYQVTRKNVDLVLNTGKVTTDTYVLDIELKQNHYETRYVPCGKQEVLAIVRNITDRVEKEAELQESHEKLKITSEALKANLIELEIAKHKAELSNQLKTQFLANMSHEIRTPMNGIIGFLQILREMDLSKEEQDSYIDLVNKSGRRLMDTINDIVEMSKIEAGYVEVNYQEVNVCETLHYYLNFFNLQVKEKGLRMSLNIPDDENEMVIVTDRHKLESTLTNLLRNAIKFTHEGRIEFGFTRSCDEILFFVKDTGIGIPASRQKAIFERFVQAEIEMSRSHEGSGLGLAISKAYIQKLNGKIWVESLENVGSTFYFSLPCNTQSLMNDTHKIVCNNVSTV